MLPLIILVVTLSFSFGAVLDSGERTADKTQLQGAAFGYEILEHRLDDMQNTFFKVISTLERAEQTRLEGQRMILELLQKGITVKQSKPRANRLITDCNEAEITGKYFLQLPDNSTVFPVVCETESFDGGWLVIQQRINGGLDFERNWQKYKNGFGYIGKSNEFWLGLEKMHQITKNEPYDLVLELKNESGQYGYALHSNFKIAGENDDYRLFDQFRMAEGTIAGGMEMSYGETFSTFGRDNDKSSENCESKYRSGWWSYNCDFINPNGPFTKDPNTAKGIFRDDWTQAATYSRIMIRRTEF